MTTLQVERVDELIRKFSISGHAGFADAGSDIVCAAISVLMTTCVNALESVGGIVAMVEQDERNALMALTLPELSGKQAMHDAQIILRTGLQGFEDISMAYPKYFTIVDRRKK